MDNLRAGIRFLLLLKEPYQRLPSAAYILKKIPACWPSIPEPCWPLIPEIPEKWPTSRRNGWPTSVRNQWPTSIGIDGQLGPEYALRLLRFFSMFFERGCWLSLDLRQSHVLCVDIPEAVEILSIAMRVEVFVGQCRWSHIESWGEIISLSSFALVINDCAGYSRS
jgi:hypothetical protein